MHITSSLLFTLPLRAYIPEAGATGTQKFPNDHVATDNCFFFFLNPLPFPEIVFAIVLVIVCVIVRVIVFVIVLVVGSLHVHQACTAVSLLLADFAFHITYPINEAPRVRTLSVTVH